ncbi:MAG: hypothetical protein Ta2G_15400 [Termitinemataceae bacterium]|nr:MAG: hypothetical protein Ta2G_15400 [Termitinemataceae bacterium]
MTQKEVEQKAYEVHEISLKYHLSNIAFACNMVNRDVYEEMNSIKQTELKRELKTAAKSGNKERIGKLLEQKEMLESIRNHVVIDYVKMAEDAGRATVVEGYIVISLPISLSVALYETNGNFNVSSAKKIRTIMAHELGHIILHTKLLLGNEGTQGTLDLSKDPQREQEAIWFADMILKLRWERIEKLHQLGF